MNESVDIETSEKAPDAPVAPVANETSSEAPKDEPVKENVSEPVA